MPLNERELLALATDRNAFTPKALHIIAQGHERSERTLGVHHNNHAYPERVT